MATNKEKKTPTRETNKIRTLYLVNKDKMQGVRIDRT